MLDLLPLLFPPQVYVFLYPILFQNYLLEVLILLLLVYIQTAN